LYGGSFFFFDFLTFGHQALLFSSLQLKRFQYGEERNFPINCTSFHNLPHLDEKMSKEGKTAILTLESQNQVQSASFFDYSHCQASAFGLFLQLLSTSC
jgi:hypothetical protein